MRWRMTRKVERQATRMHEMMDRLNVDAAALARLEQGKAYIEAQTRCLTCANSEKCLKWLDSKSAATEAETPEFCPNLRLFENYAKRDDS